MRALITIGLLVGLDNLRVGIGLGALNLRSTRRWKLALTFGLCEGVMPLVGVLMGRALIDFGGINAEWLTTTLLAACGFMVLWGVFRKKDIRPQMAKSPGLFLFPLLLSIDNLLAGGALTTLEVPIAVGAGLIGLLSATLSLLGLYGGTMVVRHLPERTELIAGATIVLVSLIGLIPV